ncbi:replication initiation protein [Vibrio cyclitrophicus]|uniref:replication initiation protein n=1 Tax=Vibrio cyclitrophicus TaxID=47951 RepID=UPI0003090D44|nr:replication initiation protein [Vibrio cyclitrophicus]OEF33670.1 RepA protein [Vibrio cyclitrophicus 1F97]PMI44192.1 RepA protein [Vibrio cyclitrophicus]
MKAEQSNALQLDLIETLPHKPYCTDELGVTHIRPKNTAIKKKYLQVNQPKLVTYLIFDIDRQGGVLAWYDNDLPTPYWTSKNPENAHAHIAYRLKVPFCTSDIAHCEPIRYAAAIESAMIERLKADRGFAGLLTKNPLHPHWQNEFWTEHEYTLDELADYLDLKGHPLRGSEVSGLGRNCELFDSVRQWSYKAIREFWAPNYKRQWNSAVYDHVEALNAQFKVPLPVSEVKGIAKSIANWTYREFTPEKFRQSQAKKGAKGGKAKGDSYNNKRLKARLLRQEGKTYQAIADQIGASKRSIITWCK